MIGKKEFKRYKRKNKSLRQRLHLSSGDEFSPYQTAYWFLWLADLLKSGFSLRHAIDLSVDMWSKNPQLTKIQTALAEGNSFSTAVKPLVNSSLQTQLTLAEEHGCLEDALIKIGNLMRMKEQQFKKLIGLIQYPCLLLLMLIAVIVMMKLYVFPELNQWMNGDQQLVMILGQVRFIACTLFGALAVTVGGLIVKYWRSSIIQRTQLLCRLPLLGACFNNYYRYYLTVNLTMLLENGLSVQQICQLFKQQGHANLLAELANYCEPYLSQGKDISQELKKFTFIPPELMAILQTGSAEDKEIDDLLALTKVLFHRLTATIEKRLAFVQPILFGILALVIVGLYLMLLLPIYSSMQGVM